MVTGNFPGMSGPLTANLFWPANRGLKNRFWLIAVLVDRRALPVAAEVEAEDGVALLLQGVAKTVPAVLVTVAALVGLEVVQDEHDGGLAPVLAGPVGALDLDAVDGVEGDGLRISGGLADQQQRQGRHHEQRPGS
jgi:hypothetical protein